MPEVTFCLGSKLGVKIHLKIFRGIRESKIANVLYRAWNKYVDGVGGGYRRYLHKQILINCADSIYGVAHANAFPKRKYAKDASCAMLRRRRNAVTLIIIVYISCDYYFEFSLSAALFCA